MKNTKKKTPPTGRFDLSVQFAARSDALPTRAQVRQWARAAYPGGGQVTVRFVGDDEGRALNASYRAKDYATNVLSFPYEAPPHLAGDLVICVPVVLREAAEQNRSPLAHFAHLVTHGMLHLQGYDHDDPREAEIMEQEEREILAALGYPDPYA